MASIDNLLAEPSTTTSTTPLSTVASMDATAATSAVESSPSTTSTSATAAAQLASRPKLPTTAAPGYEDERRDSAGWTRSRTASFAASVRTTTSASELKREQQTALAARSMQSLASMGKSLSAVADLAQDELRDMQAEFARDNRCRLPALLSAAFLGGMFVLLVCSIVQIVCIYTVPDSVLQTPVVKVISGIGNLLASGFVILGLFYVICWSSSQRQLCLTLLVAGLCFCTQGVWVYRNVDLTATIVSGLTAPLLFVGSFVVSSKNVKYFVVPFSSTAFELWLGIFKLFIVLVLPILGNTVLNGQLAKTSFLAVAAFSAACGFFAFLIRFELFDEEASSLGDVFYRVSWYHLLVTYVPVVGMGIGFIALYLMSISGLEETAELPETASAIALGFTCLCLVIVAFIIIANLSPEDSFLFRNFASVTIESRTAGRLRALGLSNMSNISNNAGNSTSPSNELQTFVA